MGGKSSPPPPPDYGPIAKASAEAAKLSFQLGKEQLAWAREEYAMNRELTDVVVTDMLARQEELDANARQDRARYEAVFQPMEDDLARDARSFNSEARREYEAGQAQSDVSAQFALARTAAQDRLESFGIDPSQTRAGALDVSARVAEATARAGAGNQARERTEAIGRALRSEAINVGRGYPGQIAGSYGLAMQAGNSAVANQHTPTQVGGQTMGNPTQWQGLGNQSLGVWSDALTSGYNAQMAHYNAQQNQSSGWGSALGMIGGIGMRMMSGGMFGAKGGVVPAVRMAEGGPVPGSPENPLDGEILPPEGGHQGVPIRPEHQPPGAPAVDGVPARLTPGEFVVPADVVRWKGEEFFQKTIQNSRKKAISDAPAQPEVRAVPVEQPVVNTAQALPVG